MSKPMTYFGSGAHMSAVLKRDLAQNKAKNPHLFTPKKHKASSMDGDGKVTVTEVTDVKAVGMSPARRHAFCTERR